MITLSFTPLDGVTSFRLGLAAGEPGYSEEGQGPGQGQEPLVGHQLRCDRFASSPSRWVRWRSISSRSCLGVVGHRDTIPGEERGDQGVGVADHRGGDATIDQAVEPEHDGEGLSRPECR